MAKFKPRLTAPAKNNKSYYSNSNIYYKIGYGMPNCTAYAWGRLLELTGKAYEKLCGNAEEWWAAADAAGLKKGQTPKPGAIAVWRAGVAGNRDDGAGHVAVVEEIKANGDIVTSNSAYTRKEEEYAAKTFYTQTVTKASGYQYSKDRPFMGFIYCGVEFEEDKKYYRIRKSWDDAASQIGAYEDLERAKKNCKEGYTVYDWNGAEVYSNTPAAAPTVDYAQGLDKKLVGTYTVKANGGLHLRAGAATSKTSLEVQPNGSTFRCYGYHTGDWLYGVSASGKTGFSLKHYLSKQ